MTAFISWVLSSMWCECLGTSFVVCVFISVHAFGDEVVLQGNLRKRGGRIIRRSRGMRTEKTGQNKIDALHLVPAAPPLTADGDFPHAPALRNWISLPTRINLPSSFQLSRQRVDFG